jgi:RNAse (barnase) inhibitor barstar
MAGGSENCYMCTFRIYPTTDFDEIKQAACEFWGKIEQKYVLTDEYFNSLVAYKDTVMNFFRNYAPLNPH